MWAIEAERPEFASIARLDFVDQPFGVVVIVLQIIVVNRAEISVSARFANLARARNWVELFYLNAVVICPIRVVEMIGRDVKNFASAVSFKVSIFEAANKGCFGPVVKSVVGFVVVGVNARGPRVLAEHCGGAERGTGGGFGVGIFAIKRAFGEAGEVGRDRVGVAAKRFDPVFEILHREEKHVFACFGRGFGHCGRPVLFL